MTFVEKLINDSQYATIDRAVSKNFGLYIHLNNGTIAMIQLADSEEELKVWWDMQGSPLPLKQ